MKTPYCRGLFPGSREHRPAQPHAAEDASGHDLAVRNDGGRLLVSPRVTPRASRDMLPPER